MNKSISASSWGFGQLGESLARDLLSLGLAKARSPLDDLILYLCTPEGNEWLVSAGRKESRRGGISLEAILIQGKGTLKEISAIKEDAKSTSGGLPTPDEQRASTFFYFAAVAAALVHHGSRISSRDGQNLKPLFLDLAGVADPPWAGLFSRAATLLP